MTGCVGLVGAGTSVQTANPTMAIIPVLLKAASSNEQIATYAFLDNGCGAVFADSVICDAQC